MLGFFRKILRLEPGISLGQWLWDKIGNNWTWLLSLLSAGGMTYLAALNRLVKAIRPYFMGSRCLIQFFGDVRWFFVDRPR